METKDEFDITERPVYNKGNVLPIDPKYGCSILPTEMDDPEDDIYETLVKDWKHHK